MLGSPLAPLVIIAGGAILLLLLESFLPNRKALVGLLSVALLTLAGVADLIQWQTTAPTALILQGAVVVDRLAQGLYLLLLISTTVTILTSLDYLEREGLPVGEYAALLFFALSGMMVMVSSNDLFTIFLGLEIMSLSVYVLVGMARDNPVANEATLKYFYLGAFSAAILLYGIALTYGAWGTIQLNEIADRLASTSGGKVPLAGLGAIFILVGLAFKVAAAPFHTWVPDVYESAPAPLAGFMASAVKAAAYGALLRILYTYVGLKYQWGDILWWLAVLTMFTGNICALGQSNIKRMLAYSSIAHSGYALVGLVALGDDLAANQGGAALLYYLYAYSFATLGAFGCVAWLSQRGEQLVDIEDFRGLGYRYPFLAIVLSLCLCSMLGLPPTAGFFGKYYLLTAAIESGYLGLAVILIANSILSIYYYLRVVANLYLGEGEAAPDSGTTATAGLALAYTAAAVIWAGMGWSTLLGILPGSATLVGMAHVAMRSIGP